MVSTYDLLVVVVHCLARRPLTWQFDRQYLAYALIAASKRADSGIFSRFASEESSTGNQVFERAFRWLKKDNYVVETGVGTGLFRITDDIRWGFGSFTYFRRLTLEQRRAVEKVAGTVQGEFRSEARW